ncbi:MAG: N-acetyl-gamma-glutamyl-phosphate reductase [Spirochaetes bacterium]|jgi:N-acetyl-gamma-glutamyl-phosphate reductase|nr:N-acetyl-gamma-glutamyl-phosphate reductase [Spirochaetota bacterium]
MKKAAIIGATGFGGCGLLEILARHPEITVTQLFAKNEINIKISDIYPHLSNFYDLEVKSMETIDYSSIDIAFFCTPDQAGMNLIDEFVARNIPVIDYSGDFRFNSMEEYKTYAVNKSMKPEHTAVDAMKHSVYGLCEKNKTAISDATIVGNPGCFAISLILPLLPLSENGIITTETIVCDSKSGVSGAGKNPGAANFYPQRYENINTYREGSHQHLVEAEMNINRKQKSNYKLFFVPQVIPMTRGILSNIYADISTSVKQADITALFEEYYRDAPFVTITDKSPNTSFVRGTNTCLIRPLVDLRTGKLLITSVIDNLMKGQSGNAVQCANILLGLNETTGLDYPSNYP